MAITYRVSKGAPLTHAELDANFSTLQTQVDDLGGGDVVLGPASATNNAFARFDTTTGKLIQNGITTEDDSGNVTVTGNISVTGTVDGRDLATDGSKLDGVEASADVTDSTNVAAAGAVMIDGSGSDITGDLVFTEKADHSSTPGAGKGYVWVKNTAPSTLIFTDDTGADTTLGAGGGGGETNTASNVGTAGVGVFKQKTGVDFEFKKINAGSTAITITDDTGNDEIDIDVDEANFDLDSMVSATTNKVYTATEQTKLAGIEAAADVTDSTNVIAAGAVMADGTGNDITGDLVFTEKADHSSTPGAGKGYLWVKNTAPSTLIFTDDGGADTTLGAGGGGGLSDVVDDTTPQLGGMLDVNGQAIGDGTLELLTFTEDASAVNHVNIENEATGGGPIISAAGDDTNIDLILAGKGSGVPKIGSNAIAHAGDLGVTYQAYDADTAKLDVIQTFTAAQTINALVTKEVDETVYNVTGTTPALDPVNGTLQYWTLTGASTPTSNLTTGQSITLLVDDGTAYAITWTLVSQWIGGSAPTLPTTGYAHIVLFNLGGTVYGLHVGNYA